jgi:hypothetical protein
MIDFDKHIQDRADKKCGQSRAWADVDNACYDHACELERYLRDWLQKNGLQIEVSRDLNILTLTNPKGHRLIISTQDHRTYEVSRLDVKDVRDELRKTYLTRLKEDRMMDELAEWLEIGEA